LANKNLLYQKKGIANVFNVIKANDALSVFPNPVTNKVFNVQFDKVPLGRYNMLLTDASGRAVLSKSLIIAMKGQVERVALPRTAGGGTYFVKLVGGGSTAAFNQEIVVQ
jgi:hypothetical protein